MAQKKKPTKKSAKKTENKAKETKKKPLESLSQIHGKDNRLGNTISTTNIRFIFGGSCLVFFC